MKLAALIASATLFILGAVLLTAPAQAGNCVLIDGQHNRTYTNLEVTKCGGVGIEVRDSTNITLVNPRARENTTNILILNSDSVTVQGGLLKDPKGPKPKGQQILIDKSTNVLIENVTTSFKKGFQEDAINAYQSSDVVIRNNSITGGKSPTGCGIIIDNGSQRVSVIDNTVKQQANCGIGVASGEDHLVEGNSVSQVGKINYYANLYSGTSCEVTFRDNLSDKPWYASIWRGNCEITEEWSP